MSGLLIETKSHPIRKGIERSQPLQLLLRQKPQAKIQYTIWLIKEIFISNITTAKVILSKSEEPELFSVKATQKTNEGKVTYANSITLTPGTVTTQIKDNVFEVHALTKEFGDDVRGSEMDRMVTWLEKGK